eukprot:CAMPEP_0202707762 /NCGR_PEP_ID=MMETSP1385-20130828/20054_1 /ASSEMBLY_ACC=CAM_ASM_000861 /TAXON_ID=933848 /ORGANISM="Elphidium margaritaceum" /LENGTH=106 /DNA_ID=CAMNT_0049366547 /DNA_START=469 /DNA_END=789 /DNA_ORIENTATION=-
MRSCAQFTAGANFTHLVANQKQPQHQLIKHGIYATLRHPSYCAYFYWAIGTQILLGNPVCAVAYALVTWKFFQTRIEYEEHFLCKFFKDEYEEYRKMTYVGIPFMH